MREHEKHCTLNPDRHCGMCDLAGLGQRPIPELVEAFYGDGLEGLSTLTECPACKLAAIRQSGAHRDIENPRYPDAAAFNYKKERDALMAEVNIERATRFRQVLPKEQREDVSRLLDIIDRLAAANHNLHRAVIDIDVAGSGREHS